MSTAGPHGVPNMTSGAFRCSGCILLHDFLDMGAFSGMETLLAQYGWRRPEPSTAIKARFRPAVTISILGRSLSVCVLVRDFARAAQDSLQEGRMTVLRRMGEWSQSRPYHHHMRERGSPVCTGFAGEARYWPRILTDDRRVTSVHTLSSAADMLTTAVPNSALNVSSSITFQ